eukprot:s2052_g6.t4
MRAGGGAKAISDLRIFYKNKYTPAHPVPRGLSMAIFRHRTGPVFNPEAFTLQEIQAVAFLCRHNKSTGADGVSYEAIQLLLQTGLSTNLLEMFNTVLWGLRQVPPSWLSSHVTFLPKTSAPSSPGELRPIVLSPTVAKVFTKALMLRLRSRLPPIRACQVGGIAGRQTLDSVCAVQHAIKLAEEYNKTLFVIKLDITAAFDSLSHEALAAFLAEASGCREAELLLEIITNTRVTLSMQGTTWEQALSQGVLQGSSYSAELFARCVDYYLAKTNASWQEHEVTWLQSSDGRKMFLTPFADDLIILGASRDQAQRLLRDTEDTLNAIGLHFNAKKCRPDSPKSPKSPGTPSQKTADTEAAKLDRESQLSEATLQHLKDWLGEEMKKIMQPGLRQLRDDNREVLKSLHEILEDKSKVDLLVEKVDRSRDVLKDLHEILEDKSKLDQIAGQDLHEILEDKSKLDQIAGQVEVLEAQISKIVEDVTWMGRVSTEGTQEQLRGLKRDSDALYSAVRDHRQNHEEIHAEHARRFMEVLKEPAALASKVHNGFAGLSGIGRSAQSAAQDAKEAAERGLEIGEKTLAAIRVGGPSPSEKELLEMVGDLQKTLAEIREELTEVGKNVEAFKAYAASSSDGGSSADGRADHGPAATAARAQPPEPHPVTSSPAFDAVGDASRALLWSYQDALHREQHGLPRRLPPRQSEAPPQRGSMLARCSPESQPDLREEACASLPRPRGSIAAQALACQARCEAPPHTWKLEHALPHGDLKSFLHKQDQLLDELREMRSMLARRDVEFEAFREDVKHLLRSGGASPHWQTMDGRVLGGTGLCEPSWAYRSTVTADFRSPLDTPVARTRLGMSGSGRPTTISPVQEMPSKSGSVDRSGSLGSQNNVTVSPEDPARRGSRDLSGDLHRAMSPQGQQDASFLWMESCGDYAFQATRRKAKASPSAKPWYCC